MASLSIESASKLSNGDVEIPDTAHQTSTDSWLQVAFVLTTGINCAFMLGFSRTIMVPLGWVGGVVGLLVVTAVSLYANCLVADLHEYGGKRHIRYRDIAGFIYGKKAYSLTWALQYISLFMINVGFIILAGFVVKAVYTLFRDDGLLKLPHCIAMAGFVCLLLALAVPNLSALGVWLGVSTVLSLVYIVIAFILSLHDGIKSPARDYSIPGAKVSKVFSTIGAAANLVFAFNTGMLPEIQATVRKRVVENTIKALCLQFTIGVFPLFAVTFVGYWAYGSSTPSYLLTGISGPVWLKVVANICAFFQTIISLHIYAIPMYEYMDTRFRVKGSALAPRNLSFRIMLRGGYLVLSTFVSALLPFLGDFMSLTGAVSLIPLTFILANHMYLLARRAKLSTVQKAWHWANIGFFGLMSMAATVSALRLIVVDYETYHLFVDI